MKKVIIVDDEYFARLALIKSVDWASYGFKVVAEAENGKDAYQVILEEAPELVILDINMPFVNGLELLKKVSEKKLHTRYILLSGHSEFEYAKEAIKYGVEAYLLKPLVEEELQEELIRIGKAIDDERKILELDAKYLEIAEKDCLRKLLAGRLKEPIEKSMLPNLRKAFDKYMRVVCVSLKSDTVNEPHLLQMVSERIDNASSDLNMVHCFLDDLIGLVLSSSKSESLAEDKIEHMFLSTYEDIMTMAQVRSCSIGISDMYTGIELTAKEFQVAKLNNLEGEGVKLSRHGELGKIDLSDLIRIYVIENLSNPDFAITDIAENFNFSYDYTCRIFKKNIGISLGDYILKVRMEEAHKLLIKEEIKTTELALKCGYSDPGYFSKVFKKYFGMTPKGMRKKINNGE
ncbi:response regulator [Acidaminobacter sp. JC074]|uniref:response regulator transcription factor n=1 Tax=Acidaminobacter sp. JC074 TaxID=2530199 RepID=UPI001F0EC1FB|nr:response regulator [Acidaminobacter sp. JC074]MCH4887694.1 response regulator [Acidaminobacter sp. JC074]